MCRRLYRILAHAFYHHRVIFDEFEVFFFFREENVYFCRKIIDYVDVIKIFALYFNWLIKMILL